MWVFGKGLKWGWANFIKVSDTAHPLMASYLEASCLPTESTRAALQVHGLVHNAGKLGAEHSWSPSPSAPSVTWWGAVLFWFHRIWSVERRLWSFMVQQTQILRTIQLTHFSNTANFNKFPHSFGPGKKQRKRAFTNYVNMFWAFFDHVPTLMSIFCVAKEVFFLPPTHPYVFR